MIRAQVGPHQAGKVLLGDRSCDGQKKRQIGLTQPLPQQPSCRTVIEGQRQIDAGIDAPDPAGAIGIIGGNLAFRLVAR